HRRPDDRTNRNQPMLWWRVAGSLLPSGTPYYADDPSEDTNVDRYRAVVEAIDTELGRLLRSLNVVDASGRYKDSSDTLCVFMSDNGTPREVAPRGDHAKGSLYEGGTRVPLIFFGEGVPAGVVSERLVGAFDLYES